MQGQVFVPYTGIGGFNMNAGISAFSISGSSMPGVVEDEDGTTVNVTWTLPGGINNVQSGGVGQWGYALVPKTIDGTPVTDDDIKAWLTKSYVHQGSVTAQPSITYTMEDIESENPAVIASIQADVNNLVKKYVSRLLKGDDGANYVDFQTYFPNCYTVGSPG